MREKIEEFCYTKKDFILDWFSGTGAGGQHRNKHQNCLRLTHIPSGIIVIATENRERGMNLKLAFQRLKEKLEPWIRNQISNSNDYPRSDKIIRTYNEAKNYVKNHESGEKIRYSDLDKQFGDMIDYRNKWMGGREA